jgi:Bifunctional DNA primase/polymerase, N-terminal
MIKTNVRRFDVLDGGRISPIEAARQWTERGYSVVPVLFRSKKPVITGWQKLRLETEELPKYFNGTPKNIGVLLGDDNGSADIDLDCYEAVSLWPQFAPATGLVFGRPTKPASHYFYRLDPPIPTAKFEDAIDGKSIIELRCLSRDGDIGLQGLFRRRYTRRLENRFALSRGWTGLRKRRPGGGPAGPPLAEVRSRASRL